MELSRLRRPDAEANALEYLLDGDQAFQYRALLFLLQCIYGAVEQTLDDQLLRLIATSARFTELYGDGAVSVLRAPARINILGEHIDYVSYLPTASLPFGSRENDMLMLFRASENDRIRGASTSEEYPPFTVALADGPVARVSNDPEADWLSYLYEHPAPAPHWGNYIAGPAYFARLKYGPQVRQGFDFLVDSRIPAGGGASSSSALVVLGNAAVCEVNQLKWTPLELARNAARAEWYVGTRGGSMDHITICLSKRDHAVLITYRDQQARHVSLPAQKVRWVTFFSQPADKGRAVMIEYNERAAVSRIIIPALIEGWKTQQPERYAAWLKALQSLQDGSATALDEVEELLRELPEALALTEIERAYPDAFAACARAFPALVAERRERPLQIRARGLHHVGEVRRVASAVQVLERLPSGDPADTEQVEAMHSLGQLLNESHESLRDLYGVSTAEVEKLIEIIRADPKVYGARLMGGGFGGNVLALTHENDVATLIETVQAAYYKPQNRHGVSEGSVMISTPGDGLATISVEEVWREAIEQFNRSGANAEKYRNGVTSLLDNIEDTTTEEVWPVIVAAGKGKRARSTGITVPKPLVPVLGVPSIVHVLRNVRAAVSTARPPIVIVSPETDAPVRAALQEQNLTFVLQPEALGTADAVLNAEEPLRHFDGLVLVVWSTQPAITPVTIRRTLKLAKLFSDYEMVLP
ncbi:MAG TPA: sugar phosphate nucleotidyltransferase, partial [Pyrinomonadaceae bacterium]